VHLFTTRRLCRLATLGAAALALTSAPLIAMPAGAAASSCAPDTGTTETMTLAAVRDDTRCLLNRKRAAEGVRALTIDRRLTGTARRHSHRMVADQFFAHDSLSGRQFSERIAATGWMDGRGSWIVGENLAWGTGTYATPRAVVKAWMRSPAHRRNIMERRFRVIGIGVMRGTPIAGVEQGMTYTTDLGS
jgi:uncharacterized protein YkwD